MGVLVESDIVNVNLIEDMFLTRLAWESTKPFVSGAQKNTEKKKTTLYYVRELVAPRGCSSFTACPTCAGLFLSALVIRFGPSVLVLLSGLQLLSVAGTVFALILEVSLSAGVIASDTP